MASKTILKGDIMSISEFKCPNGTITEKFVKMGTKGISCPMCHKKAKKIISVYTHQFIFGSEESYERMGDVPNVIFPREIILENDDTVSKVIIL